MKDPNVWPLYLKPQHDELLSSWLTRIAHNHKQKIYTFYRQDLKNAARIWNIDIDRTEREDLLKIVAKRTNSSIEEVEGATFKELQSSLFLRKDKTGQIRWVLPLGIYHTKRKRRGLLYCPLCLQKDNDKPYFRKKWRLALSIVCPSCHVYLKDSCEVCGQVVCYTRLELGKKNQISESSICVCFACNSDLRSSKGQQCETYLVENQNKIYNYIKLGYTETVNYSHLYFDALYQILRVLASDHKKALNLKKRLAQDLKIRTANIKNFENECFEYKDIYSRRILLDMAFLLLKDWPQNFVDYCRESEVFSSLLFKEQTCKEEIPYWYFNIVNRNLTVKTRSSGIADSSFVKG